MSNFDRAAVLRQNLDELASQLSELETLRHRVFRAEQEPRIQHMVKHEEGMVRRAALARQRLS